MFSKVLLFIAYITSKSPDNSKALIVYQPQRQYLRNHNVTKLQTPTI